MLAGAGELIESRDSRQIQHEPIGRLWGRTASRRWRARRCCWRTRNAAIWAIGNGLVSSTLIVYLALSVGARNFQSGFIYAAPSSGRDAAAGGAGDSGPFPPSQGVLHRGVCRQRAGAEPGAARGRVSCRPAAARRWRSSSAWCVYHLFEYCGTVALWSWTGDLVPRQIRGRFCGYRERWLVSGRLAGIAFTIALAWLWEFVAPGSPRVAAAGDVGGLRRGVHAAGGRAARRDAGRRILAERRAADAVAGGCAGDVAAAVPAARAVLLRVRVRQRHHAGRSGNLPAARSSRSPIKACRRSRQRCGPGRWPSRRRWAAGATRLAAGP